MSAEELGRRSGLSVRTIRYYQSVGLLRPPQRRGRDACYDEEHLDRLQLIARLQEQGLRLAAIADRFRNNPGGSARDWLGLSDVLEQPWLDDQPRLLGEAEVDELLAGVDDRPAVLAGLEHGGVVERRDDTMPITWLVPSPVLLDIYLGWVRLGVDVATIARLHRIMREHLAAMTDELVTRFTEDVSLSRLVEEGPGALAALLQQCRPLTRRAIDVLAALEMQRSTRVAVAEAHVPETDLNRSAS